MAVFSSARRALPRPERLPWYAAAIASSTAFFLASLLFLSVSARPELSRPVVTASSNAFEPGAGPVDAVGASGNVESGESVAPLIQPVSPNLTVEVGDDARVVDEEPPEAPFTTAQLIPSLSAGAATTIDRWAVAGIGIEMEGQLLDEYSLANIDAALSLLPEAVLANLGNPRFGPLHILVNAEGRTLSGDQPYGGPANFFSTNAATNELVLYPQQSVFTVVHELGHAYNLRNVDAGRYATVLLDPEMRSFLEASGWKITSSDAEVQSAVDHMHVQYSYQGSFEWPRVSNDDPLEDFANTFAMYFLDPEALRRASPERHAWMATRFATK
jgi:hypothetical protein